MCLTCLAGKRRRAVFSAVDGCCSALVLNCFQFPCCLPAHPFVDYPCFSDTARWMEHLLSLEESADIKLRDMVIPGTHDSGSPTIASWRPFSAVGWTQNLSITDQLRCGARYLDLRVAGAVPSDEESDIVVWHGCLSGSTFEDILREIADFLRAHQREFVVLEVVPEYGKAFSVVQRKRCLEMIQEILGDIKDEDSNKLWQASAFCKNGDGYQPLHQWSFREIVVDQKKQAVVLLHDRFYNDLGLSADEVLEQYGYCKSQRWMFNQWHNTRSVDTLLQGNLDEVSRRSNQKGRFLTNQFILTPGVGGATDVLQALVGMNSLQPSSLAVGLYDQMDDFLRKQADKSWNICSLDFIDLCPNIVHYLIALNFPVPLQILEAVVATGDGDVQVTDKLREFLSRERVLFLTNVAQDLELPEEEGRLTLACRLGDEFKVISLDFDDSTQILISYFTCHCCSNENEDHHAAAMATQHQQDRMLLSVVEGPGDGYVHNGKLCLQQEDFEGQPGTVLEYHHDGSQCEFKIRS